MTKRLKEYLRRNDLHCKSVGAKASIEVALAIIWGWNRKPVKLMRLLRDALNRQQPCIEELARHRDELKAATRDVKVR